MAHILVIDDEKNVRKMVRLALQRVGHTVDVAEDGWQGLELFGDGSGWDLVLVDQRMPRLEGRETIRAMRQRDATARTIMITSFSTIELASDVLASGATDFLRKPFSTEILRGAVEVALARPRRGAPAQLSTAETAPPMGASVDGQEQVLYQPQPGSTGATRSVPMISVSVNGLSFWPVSLPPDGTDSATGFEVRRAFRVLGPLDREAMRCIVGVTPHIWALVREELIREAAARDAMDREDLVWDMVCSSALANYLLAQAEAPPALLPIYELTANQLYDIRQMAGMGPFANY